MIEMYGRRQQQKWHLHRSPRIWRKSRQVLGRMDISSSDTNALEEKEKKIDPMGKEQNATTLASFPSRERLAR